MQWKCSQLTSSKKGNVMKLDSKYNLCACTLFYLFPKLCCIFISLISQSLVSTLKFQHSNKVGTIPIFSTSLWLKRNPKNPPCCRVLEQDAKSLPAHFKTNSKICHFIIPVSFIPKLMLFPTPCCCSLMRQDQCLLSVPRIQTWLTTLTACHPLYLPSSSSSLSTVHNVISKKKKCNKIPHPSFVPWGEKKQTCGSPEDTAIH